MQLIHYPDEASFNKAIAPHLAADPDANPRLLTEYPPLPAPIFISDNHHRLFIRSDRTDRWLPSGRDSRVAKQITMELHDLPIPGGLSGERGVTACFAENFIARGAQTTLQLYVNFYRLHELIEPTASKGAARNARPDELELLCELVSAFSIEATGINRNQQHLRKDAADWITQGTPHFWEVDNEVTTILVLYPNGPGLQRLGAMYVRPEYRGQGYSKSLIAHACRHARTQGNNVCLNADGTHPFTNQLYQSLGFIKRSEQTDYRFKLPSTP